MGVIHKGTLIFTVQSLFVAREKKAQCKNCRFTRITEAITIICFFHLLQAYATSNHVKVKGEGVNLEELMKADGHGTEFEVEYEVPGMYGLKRYSVIPAMSFYDMNQKIYKKKNPYFHSFRFQYYVFKIA